jgi:SAM-dependent methyltransferase
MTKAEKVQAILVTDDRAAARPARLHYMPPEKSGGFDLQRFFQRYPRVYAGIKAILSPTLSLHTWKGAVTDVDSRVVLNLGAGTTVLHPGMINVDFVAFPHIDVVADFSDPLPIKSGSVDAVVSISVFEHLEKAAFVMAEVARVLKPGGVFYLATPFQYPFHGAPYDYTRWTLPGLKVLLGDDFEVIASGGRGGPMGVILLALSHTAAQIGCLGSHRLYGLLNFACMGLLAPLKLLDLVLAYLPFSATLCPGLFVTARKLARPGQGTISGCRAA